MSINSLKVIFERHKADKDLGGNSRASWRQSGARINPMRIQLSFKPQKRCGILDLIQHTFLTNRLLTSF
jgi:hypothetical protein